jgi:two-component system chemotaxis response regulator CheY
MLRAVQRFKNMKILIVDDAKAMRMIVRRTLRQAGVEAERIDEACNGKEALQKITDCSPDLILCDWNMPEMTGIELLRELSKIGCKARFGFVTSEGTPQMLTEAHSAGARFVITKPFTADSFREEIAKALT